MQARSRPIGLLSRWHLLALALLFVVSMAQDFRLSNGAIEDDFHQGEYFATLVTLMNGPAGVHPLSLHGANDYIPGMIARTLFGEDKYFFPTVLSYSLLNLISAMIFLSIVFLFARQNPNTQALPVAFALVAPIVTDYKDMMLLALALCYFLAQNNRRLAVDFFLLISMGIMTAIGAQWSFDRGLTGIMLLMVVSILCIAKRRIFIVSLIFFTATFVTIGYIWPQFSLPSYWETLLFLSRTSSQWRYAWQWDTVLLTSLLGSATILAVCLTAPAVTTGAIERHRICDCAVLLTLSICMFFISTNRADVIHIVKGMWAPLLVCAYWYYGANQPAINRWQFLALSLFSVFLMIFGFQSKDVEFVPIFALGVLGIIGMTFATLANANFRMASIKVICAMTLVVPFGITMSGLARDIMAGQYRWVNQLISLSPNSQLVSEGVRMSARELKESGSICIFDLSNNGTINGLTGLPTCATFSYIVYADRKHEDEIISSLRDASPNAIVYSAKHWSYSIDGRTMRERFPDLDRFVLSRYKRQSCSYGYCIRYRN